MAVLALAAPATGAPAPSPAPGVIVVGGGGGGGGGGDGGGGDPPPDCSANATGTLSASPSVLLAGQNVTVTWSVTPEPGCAVARIMTGPGFNGHLDPIPASGSRTVTISSVGTQTWTLSSALTGPNNPTHVLTVASAQSMTAPAPTSPIAAARDSTGRLRLVMARNDGAVLRDVQIGQNDRFSGWTVVPGQLTSVAAETDGSGRVVEAGYDAYGRLFASIETAAGADDFTAWTQVAIPGVIGSVALARNGDGRVELFATTTDGTIQHARQNATGAVAFGGWSTLPGALTQVAADTNDDGRIEVVGINSASQVFSLNQTVPNGTTWSSFSPVNAWSLRSIAIAREISGQLVIVGTEPDGTLAALDQSVKNSFTWSTVRFIVGDGYGGPVAAEAQANGGVEVFGRDSVGTMSYRSLTGSAWAPLIQYKAGPANGTKRRLLVILVSWPADGDTPAAPQTTTLDQVTAMIDNQWWYEVSDGLFPGWQVTGVDPLPINTPGGFAGGDCGAGWPHGFTSDIYDEAQSLLGFDPDHYDTVVFYFSHIPCSWAGITDSDGTAVWINGGNQKTINHELGHTLGLDHAGSLDCVDKGVRVSFSANCTLSEYGDPDDTMGLDGAAGFNALERDRLGWMYVGSIVDVPASGGSYTLSPLELTTLGKLTALRLSDGTPLWIEYRERIGIDTSTSVLALPGVLIYTPHDTDLGPASGLLDLTPRTAGIIDQNLPVGSTWISPTGNFKVALDWQVSTGAHLTISLNRTTVPNLVGGDMADAQGKLRDANLTLGSVNEVVDATCTNLDKVTGQSIAPGSSVIPGTAVSVDVTVMPQPPAQCE